MYTESNYLEALIYIKTCFIKHVHFQLMSDDSVLPKGNGQKILLMLYFLMIPNQSQQVGEAQVLYENCPLQLVDLSEAVKLCWIWTLQGQVVWPDPLTACWSPYSVSGVQSYNRKTNWGHFSWKTHSLFWGIHHKIPLCRQWHQSPHEKKIIPSTSFVEEALGCSGANPSHCIPLCTGVFLDKLLSQQWFLSSDHIFPWLACKIQEKNNANNVAWYFVVHAMFSRQPHVRKFPV